MDLIRREETAGAMEIVEGQARKPSQGRVDYTLRAKVTSPTRGGGVDRGEGREFAAWSWIGAGLSGPDIDREDTGNCNFSVNRAASYSLSRGK